MSSKAKHMRRSRRSYKDVGWQTGFKMKAYKREQIKTEALSIAERLKGLARKVKNIIKEDSEDE